MAATQYQVFCRYLNTNVNHCLTNKTVQDWMSIDEYNSIASKAEEGDADAINKKAEIDKKVKEGKLVVEILQIRPEHIIKKSADQKEASQLDTDLYQIVIDESVATNPKYDMVFLYDGVTSVTGELPINADNNDTSNEPIVLYEKMKRIKSDPWFLYSTHASLQSAMAKARELVNLLGKDSVQIGKVVELDQFIEIV